MKAKLIIALLASALMLASCGDSETADPISKISSEASPAQTLETIASDTETETSPTETEQTSETSDITTEETADTEPEPPKDPVTYEELVASVDPDSVIETANGEFTFGELLASGFGNVAGDGRAYCLVKDSAGAGSLFCYSFYTVNGGGTWEQSEPISLFNGSLSAFAVEDGRAVIIDSAFALNSQLPIAYILELKEGEDGPYVSIETDENYFSAFSGADAIESERCDVTVSYEGDLNLMITMKDSISGETVYEALTALDPDTLEPSL
ncbi:MAG: hypothetical protein IJ555_05405 [Ruminococcus sp.]|nr:hypothetical protein [Ruminococcus sp.]